MKLFWTRRDLDLVETLTRRVRLLTVEQVAAGWWPERGSLRIVRRRLRRLQAAGLLHKTVVNAHPQLRVEKPLAHWNPGEPSPVFEQIAEQARARWTEPATPQDLIYAGKLAANLFGSAAGRLPRVEERDHDLLLAQIYIHYRIHQPDQAACWFGEDVFPRGGYRVKHPNAFVMGDSGRILRAINSAGRYSRRQIEAFHEHCVERDLPYELW